MRFSIRRWQDWPLAAKSAAAVSVPLALLLLALVFGYRMQQHINAADAEVRRALAIQADIQTLHSLIAEAAMAVRGYLLTGRDDFLNPYRHAQQALPATLDSLRRHVRDPVVMASLRHIDELWQRKQESLEELRIEGRSLPPADLQAHLIGSKGVLDELRTEIQITYARETELVREYSAAARRAFLRNLWVDFVTSALVLASGLGAFLLLFSGVVQRVKLLVVNAERLSRGEALETLPNGRDELGLLAERLQNASILLARRADEARAASLAKTQFLSRTSHELRTPLNAILGFAQLLETDLRGSPHSPQLEHILVAGRHLLTLIDEVLDIARIESGDLKLSLAPQSLHELAQEATDLVTPFAQRQGIVLHLVPPFADVAALADRQRLRQVLINLLSNAIKYNRPGGEVFLGVRLESDQVWISIRDTGIGIRPELLPRLFAPFERLDAEHAGVEGTGLGLAVSRQLMRCMGGDIEVQSTPGVGSVFSLRLARARRAADAPPAATSAAPATNTSQPNDMRPVLVIEDNASNLALMQALIARRPQWRMVAARDGEAGLREARAEPPALILLDLNLSGRSGESVLAELRADPAFRETPVVVVSADALPETIERLRAAGANDYLTKPLEVARFLALLDRIAA
jgi:signal transduction histidine kinase/CheY-like chemotaxis protein